MRDKDKTKAQMLKELIQMRERVSELEASEGRRVEVEEALRESEQRYLMIAGAINDGLWDWNIKTDEVTFSPRWKSMFGYEEHEIGNSPSEWFSRVHPDDLERVKGEISAHIEGYTPQLETRHRQLHKDGTYLWTFAKGIAIRDASGKSCRIVGSHTDITERVITEEQLRSGAFYDSLTGLPNRTVFMDRLGRAVERAKRHGDYLFAVMFLDLDHFKLINDGLGHAVGDQLLSAVGGRIQSCLRTSDTLGRIGGDEFVVILDGIRGVYDALRVSERIKKSLSESFNLSGQEVFTSASIGIVLSTAGYDSAEDILRDADTAMYRAKEQGRGCHEIFNKDMHTQAVTRLNLERDLRFAIEREEFRVYYQPIVSLKTGKVAGFEALVRWYHPERGIVSPVDFIPEAEETGLIVPIDRWVLNSACRQMHKWHTQFPARPPLTISVNFSRKHLLEPDVAEHVHQVLKETGLDPHSMRLEVTESYLMNDIETACAVLSRLKSLNILVHMDDFGTGYSSLSYLVRFRVDTLKIDGSFVSNMDVHGENVEIVRTIMTLARNLGMSVIAEGVETQNHFTQLKRLKCEYGQGYFFSRPLDTDSTEALIESDPQW